MRIKTLVRPVAGAAIAGALFLAPAPAALAQPAGTATDVSATARAVSGTQTRFLETQGAVFTGDVITTDPTGQAQIRFADDTKMVVGPNSQLEIDRFVFQSSTTASEVSMETVRGAFRFITGRSSKQAYRINFPGGTIGVRGTEIDMVIGPDGTGKFALWEGAFEVCDDSSPRRCALIEDPCTVIIVTPAGDFEWVQNVYERTDLLDAEFPYAFRQNLVQPTYRTSARGCEAREYTAPPESRDTAPNSEPAPGPEEEVEQDDEGEGEGEGEYGDEGYTNG